MITYGGKTTRNEYKQKGEAPAKITSPLRTSERHTTLEATVSQFYKKLANLKIIVANTNTKYTETDHVTNTK